MTLSLVFAIAENGVIGRAGALPWHLPDDLQHFKTLTSGHTVVMGRKTFEAMGRPLPNRQNVVLTRNGDLHPEGVTVVHSLADALSGANGEAEVFVIGGAQVFRQTIAKADRVYQTLVHTCVDGDTTFEMVDLSDWDLCEEEFHRADERHAYSFSFQLFARRSKRPVS